MDRNLTEEIRSAGSVTKGVEHFNHVLRDVTSACVPHHERTIRANQVQWFSRTVKNLMRRRDNTFAQAHHQPTPENWSKFRRLHKATKKESKQCWVSECSADMHSSGAFWKAYRKCAAKGTSNPALVPSLQRTDGTFAVTAFEKAQSIAETYTAAFNKNDRVPIMFDAVNELDPE